LEKKKIGKSKNKEERGAHSKEKGKGKEDSMADVITGKKRKRMISPLRPEGKMKKGRGDLLGPPSSKKKKGKKKNGERKEKGRGGLS